MRQALTLLLLLASSHAFAQQPRIWNEYSFGGFWHTVQNDLPAFFLIIAVVALLAGVFGERFRAKLARQAWQKNRRKRRWRRGVVPFNKRADAPVTDAADQLRLVMNASFKKRRLLSHSEAQVLYAAEKAIRSANLKWRVMAQVSLGEILSSPNARAYSAINSKRVDLLIISSGGDPIAAIEYQGGGHYQGTAPARDAVKKEALRRAGVRYIEFTPEHDAEDLAREISRIAHVEQLKPTLKHLAGDVATPAPWAFRASSRSE